MGLFNFGGGGSQQQNDRGQQGGPQGGSLGPGDLPTTRGEIGALRESISTRQRNLSILKSVISIGTMVVGGALLLFGAPVLGPMAAMLVGGALALGGPLITTMLTKQEEEKLKIDGEYLDSLMQGGNWGTGHWRAYRQEVAEPGYGFGQGQITPVAFSGAQPPMRGGRRGGVGGPQGGQLQHGY